MTLALLVLLATLVAGLYMAWTIGANDVANAMGTSVGSGALTLVAAVVLAAIFEFSGAVLVGASVTETIGRGIVETTFFEVTGPFGQDGPLMLAVAMLCALLAAAAWLHLATHLALPVSTTHSIVGAMVGVGVVAFGFKGVAWSKMGQIVGSWLVSPILGGLFAYLSFVAIRRLILQADDPIGATKRYSPYIVGAVVTVIFLSFIYKVLGSRFDVPPLVVSLVVALGAGAVAALLTRIIVRHADPARGTNPYLYVERIFALLQIATACFVAFAHGANDVANAVGPVSMVVMLYNSGFSSVVGAVAVPKWVLVLGGAGIVVGLATLGYRVIQTVGKEITEITPTRGFSAEFGAATTVLLASSLGLPISTTHTLVGGVIGIGFAQGIGALNLSMIRSIVGSWVATVPVAAAVAALLFFVARALIL